MPERPMEASRGRHDSWRRSLKTVQYLKYLEKKMQVLGKMILKSGFMELEKKDGGVERCIGDGYRCYGGSFR